MIAFSRWESPDSDARLNLVSTARMDRLLVRLQTFLTEAHFSYAQERTLDSTWEGSLAENLFSSVLSGSKAIAIDEDPNV